MNVAPVKHVNLTKITDVKGAIVVSFTHTVSPDVEDKKKMVKNV
jgi:hypothetical protein